ncbi:MAG: nuclear transport factor 2 family protein [Rhodoferax sp.]|nr:nuclear transport factor 2 family protein [Rhodoferax sp.]
MSQSPGLARAQIHHTMALYATSVDSGEVDGVVAAFSPDARLEVSSGGVMQGRAAIEAFYARVIGPGRPDRAAGAAVPLLRHNLTTSRVDLLSDTSARGRTYFMTLSAFGLDHAGVYTDWFSRLDDQWLIQDRTITVEWFAPGSWYEQVRLKAGGVSR